MTANVREEGRFRKTQWPSAIGGGLVQEERFRHLGRCNELLASELAAAEPMRLIAKRSVNSLAKLWEFATLRAPRGKTCRALSLGQGVGAVRFAASAR